MPYIKHALRFFFKDYNPPKKVPQTCGELNYALSMVCKAYLEEQGESYKIYNDIIGVLTCMQMEFYRRLIAPYEDKKIRENGDVF